MQADNVEVEVVHVVVVVKVEVVVVVFFTKVNVWILVRFQKERSKFCSVTFEAPAFEAKAMATVDKRI